LRPPGLAPPLRRAPSLGSKPSTRAVSTQRRWCDCAYSSIYR
jgi:hypothetical protein